MSPAEDLELHPDHGARTGHADRHPRGACARSATRPGSASSRRWSSARTRPWSVKELATALGVPQTRLYHHVEQLLAHDFIRPVERRVVSGIIETRYRVTALSFQLDRRMFEGDDAPREILHDTLVAVFDTARDEVEAAIATGVIGKGPGRRPDARLPRARPADPRARRGAAPPAPASSRPSSATTTRPRAASRGASSSRSIPSPPHRDPDPRGADRWLTTPTRRPPSRARPARVTCSACPTSAACTSPRRSPTSATG